MPKNSQTPYNLLCVAHPDDETLFFGGLLQRQKGNWRVVCVTDANADGQGAMRRKQFEKAMRLLGVAHNDWLGFPDIYENRLDVDRLINELRSLPAPKEIYTHGILGEYGHPHHQDVSYSVHEAFPASERLYSSAYNAFPEVKIALSQKEFELKCRILTEVYGTETSRFLNLLPATSSEGFVKLDRKEVRAIYDFVAHNEPLKTRQLKTYRWLTEFISTHRAFPRPF